MAQVIAGMASSHAYALRDPSRWDEGRTTSRARYAQRYGFEQPEQPQVAEESDDDITTRYARIRGGFDFVRDRLAETRPDALVFIGDDQNEHFTDHIPQIAIYLGDEFVARGELSGPATHEATPGRLPDRPRALPAGGTARYRNDAGLASRIFEECVEAGIDMTAVRTLEDDVLRAHAFGPVLRRIDPEAHIPVVPIFVNAIHVPAPTPARCYFYGQMIRKAVESYTGAPRVAFYASGGLSHFTSGYPYEHYQGPFSFGSISEEFDRFIVGKMAAGRGSETTQITNREIIGNGEIEFRSWVTMLGAIGDAKPDLLVYEPFYRGLMGMAVGYWGLQ